MLRRVVALAAVPLLACDQKVESLKQVQVPAGTEAKVGEYAAADFRRLRWLAGRWQGFQPNGEKFYEEYRIVDDSTIAMYGYPDSTFRQPSDSSRVQLRGTTVSNESLTAQWVATRLDSAGADFAPVRGARNHFSWSRESASAWNATLRWTDANGQAQRVVYALHRFGR